jgi:hypothetical protein
MSLDDGCGVHPRRQRAVGEAAVAPETRRAESVGEGWGAMADEKRSLECEPHPLDESTRPCLELVL